MADVGPMHRQVTASNGAEVDEGIAPLLEALWANGMDTEFSCQNFGEDPSWNNRTECPEPGVGYIKFTRRSDAQRFAAGPGQCRLEEHFVRFSSYLIDELTAWWTAQEVMS